MVLQEYQHDNHGMIVTNMFQTSWSGAAKVPHMFRNFMGTGAARVPAWQTWHVVVSWGGGDRWPFFLGGRGHCKLMSAIPTRLVWTYQPQGYPPYHFHKKNCNHCFFGFSSKDSTKKREKCSWRHFLDVSMVKRLLASCVTGTLQILICEMYLWVVDQAALKFWFVRCSTVVARNTV